MKENMLGKLMLAICEETALGKVALALVNVPVEMLGTLLDLVKKMAGDKGGETWKNLKHLLRGEFEIKLFVLIHWLSTTKTTATTEKFFAKDKFKLKNDGGICSYFGPNFLSWFLAGDGKIEDPLGEQELQFGKLIRKSLDAAIVEEMGGEANAETSLTEMFDQMSKQSNSEEGDLLTNGCWNTFYIPQEVKRISATRFSYTDSKDKTIKEVVVNAKYLFDRKGKCYVLRAVGVRWLVDGWIVDASSVEFPVGWSADVRVFSRNS